MSKNVYSNAIPSGQQKPIPGYEEKSVLNNAGGYGFQIGDFKQLERFLIIGTAGGTYYVTPKDLTKQNMELINKCLNQDWKKTIDMIVDVSDNGRGISNDPCIFALALALSHKGSSESDRLLCLNYAMSKIDVVIRIGTHMFHLNQYLKKLRGVGNSLKRKIGEWYTKKPYESFLYQIGKYQNRDGWTTRDVILRNHIKPHESEEWQNAFRWVLGNPEKPFDKSMLSGLPAFLEEVKSVSSVQELIYLIQKYKAPAECVPNEFKKYPEVWEAMLPDLGIEAITRNLRNMTIYGVFRNKDAVDYVCRQFQDIDRIKKSRLHPIKILNALRVYDKKADYRYSYQESIDDGSEYIPIPDICDALEYAFYNSFNYVEPTGKKFILGVDVSGSMYGNRVVTGVSGGKPTLGYLDAATVAACMAMVMKRVEKNSEIIAFSHDLVPLRISEDTKLTDVIDRMRRIPMGGTDCSLPIADALSRRLNDVDSFVTITDSETWAGRHHPITLLDQYRSRYDRDTKAIVAGVTSTGFSIYDDSPYTLNMVGFDTNFPTIISEFSK